MLNNPENLTANEYADNYVRGDNENYHRFGVAERRPCGLYHVLYRIYWNRDGSAMLTEDFAWPFYESPSWLA